MYKKFKEYAAARDLVENPISIAQNPQAQATQSNNPNTKNNVQQALMAAKKAPPPAGVNPQQYQAKITAAQNLAKTAPVANAAAAMDAANTQLKAAQQ